MDLLTRTADPALLHPAFRSALQDHLLPKLAQEGIPLALFEGFRNPERQADLYCHGRVAGIGSLGHYVTWDIAWTSHHQYGLAADLVFFLGGKWTWDEPKPGMWKRYQEIATSYGLLAVKDKTGRILEWPHCQLAWPTVKLRAGEYPPGGDQTWSENFNVAVMRWGDQPRAIRGSVHPGAPPRARVEPERPPLDAGCFPGQS